MTLLEEIRQVCTPEMAAAKDHEAIAAAVSVGRYRLRPLLITERGVMSTLGLVAGEACLQAFEEFSSATLPEGHPLKSYHPGIRRMLAWLKTDAGLDIGSAEAQTMLNFMGQLGIINQASAEKLAALPREPAPVSQEDVRNACYGPNGEWLV